MSIQGSKLCALLTRHTTNFCLVQKCGVQLGKGEVPPVASPLGRLRRHSEARGASQFAEVRA